MNPIFQRQRLRNRFEHSASSASPKGHTRKSPLRGASLKKSMSEDGDSDTEDNNDYGPYPTQQQQQPPPHSSSSQMLRQQSEQILPFNIQERERTKSMQQIPSNLFAKVGRNNSVNCLLLNSPAGISGGGNTEQAGTPSIINPLESKQNLLAEANLSAVENHIRQKVEAKTKFPEMPMTLRDMEDDDDISFVDSSKSNNVKQEEKVEAKHIKSSAQDSAVIGHQPDITKYSATSSSSSSSSAGGSGMLHFHKSEQSKPQCIVKAMDAKTWMNLKTTVFGPKGTLLEGWTGQGFTFNPNVPFGLAQRKGGPCGVLAVVQSFILKNLLFGSEFYEGDGNEEQQQKLFERNTTKFINLDDNASLNNLATKKMHALIAAIVEILWKCAIQTSPTKVAICLSGSFNIMAPTSEIYIFSTLSELKKYVRYNAHRFDCISLVYSAVLTRGIDKVQDDMDFPNSPLLGNHGYCTQELINLLTVGKAISNAFDNQIVLGDKILKGISSHVDIGFLSLFEHYDSCQVGSYLKNPKYPLWIVCSESHFSVLFSNDMNLTRKQLSDGPMPKIFNLYYYDGLARQEQLVKLTLEIGGYNGPKSPEHKPAKATFHNNNNSEREDLVPPLEKCIRTKWKDASVHWDNADPIL